MDVKWTKEQKQVIDARNSNILVSAAAGSGKTAVLVERIMGRITDPEDPVDVDELLIVTFTRAAAGEMKERITKRILDARADDPENEHLAEQTALVHNAKITTIDGFCLDVVREYGHLIGLTPGSRVAEEGETELLKQDVLKQLLEEAHAETDPEKLRNFRVFVESFATGKNEKSIEKLILRLYESASSDPDPAKWLQHADGMLGADTPAALMESPWMQDLMETAHRMILHGRDIASGNLALAYSKEGPYAYIENGESDLHIFENLASVYENAKDPSERYESLRSMLGTAEFTRLSTKKQERADPALKTRFKEEREELKKIISDLKEQYFVFGLQEVCEEVKRSRGPIRTLLELAEQFTEEYAEAKAKKNIMDFSDLEHFALRILRNEDGSGSYATREYAAKFREVMIDEYQDSNYLQEMILTAVSRIDDGEPNYFCVGDVKQSIYSFRKARPDLFIRKYHDYEEDPSKGVRIDLHRNFRSSRQVVDSVNGIFRQIMIPEIGGISYDEAAELTAGADDLDQIGQKTELLAVLADEELADGSKVLSGNRAGSADSKVLEARAVGQRIRELVKYEQIWDKQAQKMRPVTYRDIVILLRTMDGWADVFAEELENLHIPAYSTAQSGYFQAVEVQVLLNYLSMLDNPQQDEPCASVLASAFAGLSADDLGKIRSADLAVSWSGSTRRSDVSFYDAARAYAVKGPDEKLRSRLRRFFGEFDSMRDRVEDTPLHELIYAILTETGYLDFCSALPGGAQRALNLRMLVDRAVAYEHTSYIGLFNFIRYIDNLRTQNVDIGELSTISEQEDVVRIMSIHKSKGLEYPIVFVSGLSKKLNMQDVNANVLIHPVMGVASDFIDLERRERVPALSRTAIRNRMIRDSLGEELRVLYVALTRAQQKLIMSGTVENEQKLADMDLNLPLRVETLPEEFILKCSNYMQWIVPCVMRMNARAERQNVLNFLNSVGNAARMNAENSAKMGETSETGDTKADESKAASEAEPPVEIRIVKPSDVIVTEAQQGLGRKNVLESLSRLDPDEVYDSETRELIRERFSFIYPYEGQLPVPIELGVSEIKKEAVEGAGRAVEDAENASPWQLYRGFAAVEKKTEAAVKTSEGNGRDADGNAGITDKGTGQNDQTDPHDQDTDAGESIVPEFIREMRSNRENAEKKDRDDEENAGGNTGRTLSGSSRGTAFHTVMERLDYERVGQTGQIRDQIRELQKNGILTEEEAAGVDAERIKTFAESPVGKRAAEAFKNGSLRREQPFVFAMDAHEIRKEWPEGEDVCVQGVIDAFWTEKDPEGNDYIVLLDYKTDRVRSMFTLVNRYRVQIELYARALEMATGLPVKERILWSFELGKAGLV